MSVFVSGFFTAVLIAGLLMRFCPFLVEFVLDDQRLLKDFE